MSWEFENNKNATETTKKISGIHSQGVITEYQDRNRFSSFHSINTSLRDETSKTVTKPGLTYVAYP